MTSTRTIRTALVRFISRTTAKRENATYGNQDLAGPFWDTTPGSKSRPSTIAHTHGINKRLVYKDLTENGGF